MSTEVRAECVERFEIDHSRSVLQEHRSRGVEVADFPQRFRAAPIDAGHTAVATVASYRVAGEPLLWFSPDNHEVVIDSTFSGDLNAVDPTRMSPGETAALGLLQPSARAALPAREIGRFLIESGMIRTYWHIGAELCLESESTDVIGYRATYSGVHTYFTNEQNQDAFRFVFAIGPDGALTIAIP